MVLYFCIKYKYMGGSMRVSNLKRVMAVMISFVMLLGLTGCGGAKKAVDMTLEATEETESETEETTELVDENAENVNLLENGDFSNGTEHWGTYITKGGAGKFSADGGVGKLEISNTGGAEYAVQLYYDGFPLKMGGVYEFSFDISSTVDRNMEARIQVNGGDYSPYISELVDITSDMKTYSYTFSMEDGGDPAPRMCFNLGTTIDGVGYDTHTVEIDNISLKITDASNIAEVVKEDNSVDCNLNQVGYMPDARKTVVIRSEEPIKGFTVVDDSNKEVYKGTLSNAIDSVNAGDTVYIGDFSDFNKPGTYKVISENGKESYPFAIGDNIYQDLLKDSFRMLYLQRCGMELDSTLAGDFAHPICHNTEAVIYGTDTKKEVNGGWHDAGDYGRYVVTGAETVADLLLAYEDYQDIWNGNDADAFNIPESGNGIPDILDEARYELDWLLKMQDDTSGGVYHKVTCREFPGFVMPQEETEELVLSPISTTATADFAAIMAKSSTVFKDIDPEFSAKALKAALNAWKYLENNGNSSGFHNPEDILTGEYLDGQDKDERYWASVELYKITKDTKFKTIIEDMMELYILQGYGWKEMGSYGNIAYLSVDESMKNPTYEDKLKKEVIARAEEYITNSKEDGYLVSLGDDYIWGSNMAVSNNARQMIMAEQLSDNKDFGTYAYDQLSYLLGQNALSYCFITGYGSVSPKHAHHRPSMATKKVLKGMVIGGPDSALEDPFMVSTMADVAPAKCYVDSDQSFSTNEVTIYWNSPFIYFLSAEMSRNK